MNMASDSVSIPDRDENHVEASDATTIAAPPAEAVESLDEPAGDEGTDAGFLESQGCAFQRLPSSVVERWVIATGQKSVYSLA